MDILDKLFSRELKRRTGERAIKIDSDKKDAARQRMKLFGKKVINNTKHNKSINKHIKKTKQTRETNSNLFQRLNIRFPWLKIVAVLVVGIIAILDLLDVTISKVGDPMHRLRTAPMSKHVKATDRVFEGRKLVALTFDDGPSRLTTPRLLDVLHKKDALASFFMLGTMARNNLEIVKRVANEGHDVASHTMYHQNLLRVKPEAAEADIMEAKSTFKNILGREIKYTRPPYGNINGVVRNSVKTPIILWSVDTLDWKNRNVDAIMAEVKKQVFDGAIILMHDIYDTSVDAVGLIIDELRKDGYEFLTISEMIKYKDIKLENGVEYRSF